MKKSDLVRVIREVVKREVRSALKEELGNRQPIKEKITRKKKEKITQTFSDNPLLNEVMQETATDTWTSMGNREFNSTDALAGRAGLASMMGMESPDQVFGQKPTVSQMLPDDRKHVQIKPELEQALTRDYSQLMKAIDKKKK